MTMGVKTGDKSRYHRRRRKKLARRVEMRALRKEVAEKAPKKEPPSEAVTAAD
jgi:hypothetical protein